MDPSTIVVTLGQGRRVDAQVRGHRVHTDQPLNKGGEDSAVSPFELFLTSLATCAGVFVQGFCTKREIPTEGIRVVQRVTYSTDGADLTGVQLELQVPPDFPQKYHAPLLRVVEQCSVKRAIAAQPQIAVQLETVSEGRAAADTKESVNVSGSQL